MNLGHLGPCLFLARSTPVPLGQQPEMCFLTWILLEWFSRPVFHGFSRLQGSSHVFETDSHDSNILIQLCKEPAPRIGAGIVLLQAENGVPCEPSRRISQLAECHLHHFAIVYIPLHDQEPACPSLLSCSPFLGNT